MTTFTLQDLNTNNTNNLPNTPEEDEAMKELFEKMGQDLTGKVPDLGVNAFETPAFSITPQHAPVPQPTQMGEPLPNPDLSTIINTICAQLQLLATVINQHQPNTTPPEGDHPSLQETIELTLQQADWFEKMVKEAVEERVEYEVDSYFEHRFDPTDHFDFNDAVCNEVSDQIDDIVRDQLDDVVESKLKDAHITINF